MRKLTLTVLLFLSVACTNETSTSQNCGDGVVDSGGECDDTEFGGATCVSLGYHGGALTCSSDCTFVRTACETFGSCGDGALQSDFEECEGTNFGQATCLSRGYESGSLSCTEGCTIDESGCVGKLCGNGEVDGMEACDGTNLGGADCESIGYYGGTLTCSSDCTFDMEGCEAYGKCGDGAIQSMYSEECDGAQLGGRAAPL